MAQNNSAVKCEIQLMSITITLTKELMKASSLLEPGINKHCCRSTNFSFLILEGWGEASIGKTTYKTHLWSFRHEQAYRGLSDPAPHTILEACSWRPVFTIPLSNIIQTKLYKWQRNAKRSLASIKLASGNMARQMSRSLL